MHPIDSETLVSRHLQRLPTPRAPHTLLPRVLAAVQAWSRRPWYAREWFTWPLVWQLVSSALLILILIGGVVALPIVRLAVQSATSTFTSAFLIDAPPLARGLEVTTNMARVLWRALIQPFLPYVLVLVGLMCAACATFAVALNRAVFGRALHS